MSDAIPSKAGVYRIFNALNQHCYIGSSVDIRKRVHKHFSELRTGTHHSLHLQRAFVLYGSSVFDVEVLEVLEPYEPRQTFIRHLRTREQYYFGSMSPEYNVSPNAECPMPILSPESRKKVGRAVRAWRLSPEGQEHTRKHNEWLWSNPELRAIISAKAKARMGTDEARETSRQRATDQWHDNEERRARARALALAQWQDSEIRAKRIAAIRNRAPISEETRAKIRAASSGRKASEETRAKMRAKRHGVPQGPHSLETRRKIGDAQRGRPRGWEYTPESRAKLSASLKGKKKTPEHLAKLRASRAATRRAKMLQAGQQALF